MNYREYVKNEIEKKFKQVDERFNIQVYDQSDAKFDGGIFDVSVIINDNGGSTFSDDLIVAPINIMVLSAGMNCIIDEETENTPYDITYNIMKEFVRENNLKTITLNAGEYIKQNLMLPVSINSLENDAGTFRINFIIQGNLSYLKNINDIKQILIDGEDVKYINASLIYATTSSNHIPKDKKLTRYKTQYGILQLQLTLHNRTNILTNKLIQLRQDAISLNTLFEVKIIFNTHEETYQCINAEHSITSDNINPTGLTIKMSLTE